MPIILTAEIVARKPSVMAKIIHDVAERDPSGKSLVASIYLAAKEDHHPLLTDTHRSNAQSLAQFGILQERDGVFRFTYYGDAIYRELKRFYDIKVD